MATITPEQMQAPMLQQGTGGLTANNTNMMNTAGARSTHIADLLKRGISGDYVDPLAAGMDAGTAKLDAAFKKKQKEIDAKKAAKELLEKIVT